MPENLHFFKVLHMILMCLLVEPKGLNSPEQNFRHSVGCCGGVKRGGLQGKEGHFPGTPRSVTSYECPCVLSGVPETISCCVFSAFLQQWRQIVVGSGGARTRSPGARTTHVSLCCFSLQWPEDWCLEAQPLRFPFPIRSGVFSVLFPALNNFSSFCPVHITHSAPRVSDLWTLL